MQYDPVLKKLNFNLLTPRVGAGGGGGGGGSAGIIFATMLHIAAPEIPFNLIRNMTMLWKNLILPLTPPPKSTQVSDTGLWSKVRFDMFLIYCTFVCICYHVAAFAIPFDMQHDNVLKKFNFNLLTPGPWGGGLGGYICYHVAAFKLICNMTRFWKSLFWHFDRTPRVGWG